MNKYKRTRKLAAAALITVALINVNAMEVADKETAQKLVVKQLKLDKNLSNLKRKISKKLKKKGVSQSVLKELKNAKTEREVKFISKKYLI